MGPDAQGGATARRSYFTDEREMRLRYRFSILLGLCVATALGVMAPLGAAGARADSATLKKIASRSGEPQLA